MDKVADEGDDADLFQVQGMWHIQVVKDSAGCLDRVAPFTHSQITGDDGDDDCDDQDVGVGDDGGGDGSAGGDDGDAGGRFHPQSNHKLTSSQSSEMRSPNLKL